MPWVFVPRAGDGEALGRACVGVAAGFCAAAGFGVGVDGSGVAVGAGVALRRSLTAWATVGPATTPVTAVLAVMNAPRMPNPIGLLKNAPSMQFDLHLEHRHLSPTHEHDGTTSRCVGALGCTLAPSVVLTKKTYAQAAVAIVEFLKRGLSQKKNAGVMRRRRGAAGKKYCVATRVVAGSSARFYPPWGASPQACDY